MREEKWLVVSVAGMSSRMVIINNLRHWMDNEDDLLQWLEYNTKLGKTTQAGLVLTFYDETELTAFLLRWG